MAVLCTSSGLVSRALFFLIIDRDGLSLLRLDLPEIEPNKEELVAAGCEFCPEGTMESDPYGLLVRRLSGIRGCAIWA
jgi:hypothetical protein